MHGQDDIFATMIDMGLIFLKIALEYKTGMLLHNKTCCVELLVDYDCANSRGTIPGRISNVCCSSTHVFEVYEKNCTYICTRYVRGVCVPQSCLPREQQGYGLRNSLLNLYHFILCGSWWMTSECNTMYWARN